MHFTHCTSFRGLTLFAVVAWQKDGSLVMFGHDTFLFHPFSEIGNSAQQKQSLIPSRPPGNISHQKGKFGKSSTQQCLLTGGNMWLRRRVDVKRKLWLYSSAGPIPCFCSYGVPFSTNKLLISFEGGLQMFCFKTGEMDGYGFLLNSNNNNNNKNKEKHTFISKFIQFPCLFGCSLSFLVGSWLVGWFCIRPGDNLSGRASLVFSLAPWLLRDSWKGYISRCGHVWNIIYISLPKPTVRPWK